MKIRNRETIFKITSQAKACEFRPLLNSGQRIFYDAYPKSLQQGPSHRVTTKLYLFAENFLHFGFYVRHAVYQAEFDGTPGQPDFASKQILILGQFASAASQDVLFEIRMDVFQNRLEPRDVFFVFGAKRVEHGFGFAGGVHAPLDAMPSQKLMRTKAGRDDTDGPDDRAVVCPDLVRCCRQPVSTRCSDIFNKGIDLGFGFFRDDCLVFFGDELGLTLWSAILGE